MRIAFSALFASRRRAWAILACVFLCWHALLCALGVQFDATSLMPLAPGAQGNWALLDPEWLRHDLARSLFVLHSQPPLFNLFIGLVLKLAGPHAPEALHVLFVAGELALYLATFDLMRWLSVGPVISFVLSTAYLVSPAAVLYEHWLFYTLPVGVLLVLSARLLAKSLDSPRPLFIGGALVLTMCLVGIRSIFHPAFFFVVAGTLAWALPAKRRLVLACAAAPGLCIALWMARGAIMFDSATFSSWLGMSMARVATEGFTRSELQALAVDGKLSPIAEIPPFSPSERYAPLVLDSGLRGEWSQWPALTTRVKPTGGINFNHSAYLSASRLYLHDSLQLLRMDPSKALRGVVRAWFTYGCSSTLFGTFLPADVSALRPVWWTDTEGFELPLPREFDGFSTVPLPFLIGLLATIFGALALAARAPTWSALGRNQRLVLLYLSLTAVGFALVACCFETGENNRMRAEIDPVHLVLLGVVTDRVVRWWNRAAPR